MRISVLITTLNEERNLDRCLQSITAHNDVFDEVIIIDSNSVDKTSAIAQAHGARVENFQWNGQYPKKRQWTLDNTSIKNDWVFWLDADEVITPSFVDEIRHLNGQQAGYFIKGRYVIGDKPLRFGLSNNKLALFNRHKIEFPVVNDLAVPEMGEMEGHYQPVLKSEYEAQEIGQISEPIMHYAYQDQSEWNDRHDRYARWEAYMIANQNYPKDPVPWRQGMKMIFRSMPCRAVIMFVYSYIVKGGVFGGRAGLSFALSRYHYYSRVSALLQANKATDKSAVS